MSAKSPLSLSERRKLYRKRVLDSGRCLNCLGPREDTDRTKCKTCREEQAIYYKENRQKIVARALKHQRAHWDQKRAYFRSYTRSRRLEMIEKMGGKCTRCGFADPRALQVDHVNGDGFLDNTGAGARHGRLCTGTTFFKKVLADTEGRYQLLCANCNWIKRWENEEHSGNGSIAQRHRRKIASE